jgi:hypothetical protein
MANQAVEVTLLRWRSAAYLTADVRRRSRMPPKNVQCWNYKHEKRRVLLVPGLSKQDFLDVLCVDYEASARFMLDWAATDFDAARGFLARFLVLVRSELQLGSSELLPLPGRGERLRSPGGSVCWVALLRFCELLYENPPFVRAVQAEDSYSSLSDGYDLFANREHNTIARTRGRAWEAKGFHDPQPIDRNA